MIVIFALPSHPIFNLSDVAQPRGTRHIRDTLDALTRCSSSDAMTVDEIFVSRAVRKPAPNLCNVVLRTV